MTHSMTVAKSVRIAVALAALLTVVASLLLARFAPPPADAFWERLRIAGLETSQFASLREMTLASDAIVVAKVTSVAISRTLLGDSIDDVVTYGRVNLEIVRVVAGQAPRTVPLEFLLGPTPQKAAADVQLLRQALPTGTALYFLHEKQGKDEQGLYRAINSAGLWSATTRGPLDAPLRELSASESGLFASEIGGMTSVDELVDLVESYVASQ